MLSFSSQIQRKRGEKRKSIAHCALLSLKPSKWEFLGETQNLKESNKFLEIVTSMRKTLLSDETSKKLAESPNVSAQVMH